jgi:hypothetical protein
VAKLAKAAHRSWAKVYLIQGMPDFGRGRGDMTRRDRQPGDNGPGRSGPDWFNMTDEEREQRRLEREAVEKELVQTLPADQQAKLAEQQQQRDKAREEMANMTDEQRRARFEEMRANGGGPGGRFGGGNREQQRLERIKNTTPEQKVERYRTMIEQRARWEQRRQQGGGR